MLAKKPIKHSSNDQAIAIHILLQQKLTVVTPADKDTGEPAIVAYAAGWDDTRVAQTIDPALSAKSAAKVRVKFFGILRPPMLPGAMTASQEALIDVMLDIEALKSNLNKLITMLATQKIVSCGDLLLKSEDGSIPGVARAPNDHALMAR